MQISYYGFHASNTEGTHHIWANDVAVAADAEFESTLSESKSDVLPLHQSAILYKSPFLSVTEGKIGMFQSTEAFTVSIVRVLDMNVYASAGDLDCQVTSNTITILLKLQPYLSECHLVNFITIGKFSCIVKIVVSNLHIRKYIVFF